MKVFTYTEARQKLSSLLDRARRDGGVGIRRRNGQIFVLKPERPAGSPLDVKGIDLGVTTEGIVAFIRESRKTRPRG